MRSAAMLLGITLLAITLHLVSADEDGYGSHFEPSMGENCGYGYDDGDGGYAYNCDEDTPVEVAKAALGVSWGKTHVLLRAAAAKEEEDAAEKGEEAIAIEPDVKHKDIDMTKGMADANGQCMFAGLSGKTDTNPQGLNKKFRFYLDDLEDDSALENCDATCDRNAECIGYTFWKPEDGKVFHFAKCILYGKGVFKRGVTKKKRFTHQGWQEEMAKGTKKTGNIKYFKDVKDWVDMQAIQRVTTTTKQPEGNMHAWIGIGNNNDAANLQPEIIVARAPVTYTKKLHKMKVDTSWTCHKKEASLLASATTTASEPAASDSGVTASTVFAFAGGLSMGAIATALVAKKMHGRAAVEYARVTEEDPLQPGMSDV